MDVVSGTPFLRGDLVMVGELEFGGKHSVAGKLAHPHFVHNSIFVDADASFFVVSAKFSWSTMKASHLMKSVPSLSAIRTGIIMVAAVTSNSTNPVTNMGETEPESNRVREKRYTVTYTIAICRISSTLTNIIIAVQSVSIGDFAICSVL